MKKKSASSLQKKLVQLLTIIGGVLLGFFIGLFLLSDISSLPYLEKERIFLPIENKNSDVVGITEEMPISSSPTLNTETFLEDSRPKIGLVLLKVGLDRQSTQQAIETLPKEISFAFVPYTPDIEYWSFQTQSQGREVLLILPLESVSFDSDKEAPYTLLTNIPKEKNLQKLEKILSKINNPVGVVGFMGARFLASRKDLYPILEFLKTKGYLFIDSQASSYSAVEELEKYIKGPFLQSDCIVEEGESKESIKGELRLLEEEAQKKGSALGLIYLSADMLPFLQEWASSLEAKGIVLVPVTSLLEDNV